MAQEKGLTINLEFAENLPKIETDEAKIHQVLTNIIGNAIKFTQQGKVNIQVFNNLENIIIKVQDSGIGISQDAIKNIFEEFRQVDGSSSRPYKGTGLGLAIANKLTKVLGGKIEVDSIINQGTTFTITFPIKWNEAGNFDSIFEETQRVSSSYKKEKHNTRILIVEDNKTTIMGIKVALEKHNFLVDVVQGGKQALEYIKHTTPDGIILDLIMPVMDGFEVLTKIRSTEKEKNIPVLILTAKDLKREDLTKLSKNNIQELIQKGDINITDLLFKIKKMFGYEIKEEESLTSKFKMQQNINNLSKPSSSVLIIEDKPDNMITTKAILGNSYKIIEAVNGKEGVKKAITETPDLILLDISLPEMDGFEVIKIIRNTQTIKNIPVIALTAKAMKGDREKILQGGCNDYMAKPINPEKLIKLVNKWLEKNRTS